MVRHFQSQKEPHSFQLNIPTHIYAGMGESEKVKEIVAPYGQRVLVVSMRTLVRSAERFKEKIEAAGAHAEVVLLENVEPTCMHIDSLKEGLKGSGVACIIGIGGGTAIDTAKALAIALTHSNPIWDYANLSNRPPLPLVNPVLPVITIPTTSGTGSEVTPYSVLTNTYTKQKGTIQHPEIFPRIAVLDPDLTKTQPPPLTAATGVDAFIQAVESWINVSKYSPVAEWAAREAIALAYRSLPEAYSDPENVGPRLEMCWASALSGIAISHRGTTSIHAIAEPLGALTHIPHSDAVALCALPVLRHTWEHAVEKFAALCDVLEPDRYYTKRSAYKAEKAIELIGSMFKKIGMPKKKQASADLGEIAAELVKNVLEYKFRPLAQHPIRYNEESLAKIIEEIVKE